MQPQHVGEHSELNIDSEIWTDLKSSLLMGPSFLEPSNVFDPQIHSLPISQSSLLDTSLASANFDQGIADSLLSINLPQIQAEWFPSSSQIATGCQLFFTHVSHFVPFLHQPSFDATQISNHLLLSILCLGYQYGKDPDSGHQADSGASLAVRCFHRARLLVAPDEEKADVSTRGITMVQAYLLLQIYAMMYLCGDDSAYGLKTHSKMISLARACGLMLPISVESAATENLDSLWRQFIKTESHKRTLFAIHQIDALWTLSTKFYFSILLQPSVFLCFRYTLAILISMFYTYVFQGHMVIYDSRYYARTRLSMQLSTATTHQPQQCPHLILRGRLVHAFTL